MGRSHCASGSFVIMRDDELQTMSKTYNSSNQEKPIGEQDGVISEERLTYPIVYYPGFYGTFFAFRQTQESPLTLCSCFRVAIENYLSITLEYRISRGCLLDSRAFPIALVEDIMKQGILDPKELIRSLSFHHKLCHECNGITPTYRYCHHFYGSGFAQNY